MPSVVMPIILQLREIGKIFDMDYTAVSQGVRRFRNNIKEDDTIRKKLESVLELLNSNECQM
jgi:chromosomal replication initiation ATPase DnaA